MSKFTTEERNTMFTFRGCARTYTVLLLLSAITATSWAQSTSDWKRVGDGASSTTPKLGASYMSMQLLSAAVYPNSNWWTSLIERNRSASASVNIAGTLSSGKAYSDSRISQPLRMEKNREMLDFGWRQDLIHNLPVDFLSLSVEVAIDKSAQDGIDQLITAANSISQTTPPLSISQAVTGEVTAAKSVLDFIFGKQLVVPKLHSTSPLTATAADALAPGIYVCLGGTNRKDYAKYLQPAPGGTGLAWVNSLLTYSGKPVTDVTYFVVDVEYKDALYDPSLLPDAALTSQAPWAALYLKANQQVMQIVDPNNYQDLLTAIRRTEQDGDALLVQDPSFVQSERQLIMDKENLALTSAVNRRLKALRDVAAPAAAQGVGTSNPGGVQVGVPPQPQP